MHAAFREWAESFLVLFLVHLGSVASLLDVSNGVWYSTTTVLSTFTKGEPVASFLEEVNAERLRGLCPLGEWLEVANPATVFEVQEALDGPYATAEILRALRKRGVNINRHRLQQCRTGFQEMCNCECGLLRKG
jgi:hypothetical protein